MARITRFRFRHRYCHHGGGRTLITGRKPYTAKTFGGGTNRLTTTLA
jgi:hypothetical protein